VSQSLLYHAFGIRKGYEYVRTVYGDGCISFVLVARQELLVCPRCHSAEVSRKGRRFRQLQTVPIGFKRMWLVTEVPQCKCLACGQSFEVAPLLPQRMFLTRIGSKPLSRVCGGG
jgi:Zn finger protein HypA/HybF involved in hydrogenase expression